MSGPPERKVRLAHGAGGRAMRELIERTLLSPTAPAEALAMDDGAVVSPLPWSGDGHLVVTTDAHVVQPLEFPGGDIGRLAVCGAINDLAVMGATEVLALTCAVVLEEGFELEVLARLQASVHRACAEARAPLLCGDTKVLRRGELDGVVYATTGLGRARRVIRDSGMAPGDLVVVTGTIGDHGLAVLAARHQLGFGSELRSDVAPLGELIAGALAAGGAAVHAMKDPTRGGVTSALLEMAGKAKVSVRLQGEALPVSAPVRAASELLGIDPLEVANEGKALLAVAPDAAPAVLAALRAHPLGRDAAVIGLVGAGEPGEVTLDTGFGVRRLVEREGDPLPRIC